MELNNNNNKLTNNLIAKKPNKAEEEEEEEEDVKVIEWENYEEELVKLLSLSSALNEANLKKQRLTTKLESLIQVKAESLSRFNELEEMRQKLEAREASTASMLTRSKVAMEDSKNREEWLSSEVRSLLVAGTTLSVARKQVELSQESNRSLSGEKGYAYLRKLQRRLRLRQQYMISQVSLLYPVKTSMGHSREQELDSLPSSSRSGISAETKPVKHGSLMILGLQLTMLPFTKMSFFTNKKEVQRSAAALGYVAHAVSLIASYLEVPLRYPIRLGGSHSYIKDSASSIESTSSDMSLTTSPSTNMPVEFPLFLDGQDTTRAAYAVFLLNKDLEQLLNFIGVSSLGPRHVLANLKELMRIILSADYIDYI